MRASASMSHATLTEMKAQSLELGLLQHCSRVILAQDLELVS